MRKRVTKLLAMALCVAMALSLVCVPAMGAAPMMGETAVAEAVPEDVGTMPETPVSHPVVKQEAAQVSAFTESSYAHSFGDGLTDPNGFFTSSGNFKTGISVTVPGVGEITKGLKTESKNGTITFTAPAAGTVKIYLDSSSTKPAVNGIEQTPNSDCTVTFDTVSGTTYTIKKGSGESHIAYIEWRTSHTHQFGEWVVDNDSTCTAEGSKHRTCTAANCDLPGGTQTEPIEKKAHTETTIPAVPATCVTDGASAGKKCSVCDTVLEAPTVVKATGVHTWNAAQTECTVCHLEKNHTHTLDAGTVTKEPTCTEDGVKTFKCVDFAKCGHSETQPIKKLGHDLEHHEAQAATCTAKGWDAYDACKRCDYTTYKEIPAGHKDANKDNICDVCKEEMGKPLTNAGGWFETLYAVLPGVTDADVTAVSYSGTMDGELTGEDLEYLVRDSADGVRVDIPGIPAGTYTLKVTAKGTVYEANNIEVMEHDRSGFAHYQYTDGVGAYRDDGILKENAIVLYVTEDTKNTVTLTSGDGTTVSGIGNILNTVGQEYSAGTGQCKRVSDGHTYYGIANTNAGILKKLSEDDTPLVVRIIGSVKSGHPAPQAGGIDGLTAYDTWDYGGSVGDNGNMARIKDARNITIEGVGPDATIDGWGIHFMAGEGYLKGGKSFEVRNLSFRNVPEDCIGMEGIQSGSVITAPVEHCWIHNCAFYAPKISPCAESDKNGGDGACDFKRGHYMTMDYCYYEDYHKTNLVGSSDSSLQYHITWHHNYWKTCKSRGPLGRNADMHIYNCIYDGQTDFAMNTRASCYIFSEYNTFLNCKRPRRFDDGAIKSYNDVLSCSLDDATSGVFTVTDKTQKVSSGNKYENFDTNPDICYIPSGDYKLDTDYAVAKANITAYCGTMKAQPIKAEDVNGSTVAEDHTPKDNVGLPYDKDITSAVVTAASGTFDNIVFTNVKPSADNVKYGKDDVGQYVVFKVGEAVDVTMDGTASVLVNSAGATVAEIPGSANNLPAGIYYIQPATVQPANIEKGTPMSFKEGTLTHLTIKPTTATTPPHEHNFTGWKQTVDPTCTRAGVELGTCSCGATQPREIGKVNHVYVGGACQWCNLMEGTLSGGTTGGEKVAVTGLTLDFTGDTLSLLEGKSQRVIATVAPSNASNKKVVWTSGNESVATVAPNGTITAKGPGTTVITATTADGGFTKSFTVSVIGVATSTYTFSVSKDAPKTVTDKTKGEDPVADGSKWGTSQYFTNHGGKNTWKAKGYKSGNMTTNALLLATGAASSLDFTVPADTTAKVTLNFSSTGSSNTSAIAILDANGQRVGNAVHVAQGTASQSVDYEVPAGTYRIVAPTDVLPSDVSESLDAFGADGKNDPNQRGVWLTSVTVVEEKVTSGDYVAVTGVTLDQTTVNMKVGQNLTLHATVAPANATNQSVNWTSSDSTIARVSAGTVVGSKAGTATITATSGGKSATCTVTVIAAEPDPVKVRTITISGGDTVEIHQTLTLTANVLPDDADNKTVRWTSSDNKIATVSAAGVVTAEGVGTVTITAAATDGSDVKATKTITVTDAHHAADTLGDNEEYHWSVTKGGKLDLSKTATGTGAVQGDVFFAATWDKDGKFLGVKIIDATAAELTAQLDSSWAHLKLIWTDVKESPKCQAAETNK